MPEVGVSGSAPAGAPRSLLRVGREGRVTVLTIDSPEAMNAMSPALGAEIITALDAAEADAGVGAVILTGAGEVFSAGGDIRGLVSSLDRAAGGGEAARAEGERAALAATTQACLRLSDCRKPTIAAINGAAAGGGLALAAACDIRIAAQGAKLAFAYPRIGLGGDLAATWSLNRILGPARAREFCLLAPVLSGDAALAMGLVGAVHPAESLMAEALKTAARLAAMPPMALAHIKANLDAAASLPRDQAIAVEAANFIVARASADHKEAASAFIEKRAGKYTGT